MTDPAQVLFLAWQEPRDRRWYTIGRLSHDSAGYRFVYSLGYLEAANESGLKPLPEFPKIGREYCSSELFPLFQNRIMLPSREDFPDYLERLALEGSPEPLQLLARSEGRRSTDTFQVFPCPSPVEASGSRDYNIHFFVHGLRHTPPSAQKRAADLVAGERLYLLADCQNPFDSQAASLRTDDNYLLGWIPRYYSPDILEFRAEEMVIKVERVNPPPAVVQQRVLCHLVVPWPGDFRPFARSEFEPYLLGSPAQPPVDADRPGAEN